MDNPKLGISEYDSCYEAYHCVYCDGVVALTTKTLEILYQEELDRLRDGQETLVLLPCEAEQLWREIEERESGLQFGFRQYIHNRCLDLLKQPQNRNLLDLIRERSKTNVVIPTSKDYCLYDLNYSSVAECLIQCVYCGNVITASWQGFAYCARQDRQRQCLHMHFSCYNLLKEAAQEESNRLSTVRHNLKHLLGLDRSVKPWLKSSNQSIEKLAQWNDLWVRYLEQYVLSEDERLELQEWLDFLQTQRSGWTQEQTSEWLCRLKEEDLTPLAQEVRSLTSEQLEAELSGPPLCVPTPQPQGCLTGTPLLKRHPERLYRNLSLV